jgi:hypothetical protein
MYSTPGERTMSNTNQELDSFDNNLLANLFSGEIQDFFPFFVNVDVPLGISHQ